MVKEQIQEALKTAMLIGIQVGICVLIPLFIIHSFKSEKQIERNFGKTLHWQANAAMPIVLEVEREKMLTHRTASYNYYLYLHLHGQTFICRYDNEKFSSHSGAATYLLYFYSKRKIELAEIKVAFERGEGAPEKAPPRYCSIKYMRFKHLSDIEHIAAKKADKARSSQREQRYAEYLADYKKHFFQ